MSYKMNSSNCSLKEDSSESSVIAKLRRLKIEENLLVNNINKMNPKETEADDSELPIIYSLDLKNCTAKLKNNLTEIRSMFEDLKTMTMTEEKLSSIGPCPFQEPDILFALVFIPLILEIGSMKRDVVKLDEKIRLIKSYVHSELSSEMSKEKVLRKQVDDVEERQSKRRFKPKTKIKPFNQIVPSPVKVMIQSPLKCKEVQNLQEFMMSSPNRYGGWNEYHHNVFVQIWQKHFKSNEESVLNESQALTVLNHNQFQPFKLEVLEKITGCTNDDILSHHKWYCKYLYLKEQQQNALNKWKRTRGILSKSRICDDHDKKSVCTPNPYNCNRVTAFTNMENVEELLDTIETCNADEIADALCDMTLQEGLSLDTEIDKSGDSKALGDAIKQKKRSFGDALKPTKQWISRCNSEREGGKEYKDLQSIKKLRIPDWRLSLQD